LTSLCKGVILQRMKAEIKKMWVAALKSDKYKQGQGQLKKGTKFCCLGVLCDLHHKITKGGKWIKMDHGSHKNDPLYFCADTPEFGGSSFYTLPEPVREWAEMGDDDLRVEYGGKKFGLATLNDGFENPKSKTKIKPIKRLTFKQIAVIINKQL